MSTQEWLLRPCETLQARATVSDAQFKMRNDISVRLWRNKKRKCHIITASLSSTMLTVVFKLFIFGFLTTNLHYQDPQVLPQANVNVDVTFSYPPANAKID